MKTSRRFPQPWPHADQPCVDSPRELHCCSPSRVSYCDSTRNLFVLAAAALICSTPISSPSSIRTARAATCVIRTPSARLNRRAPLIISSRYLAGRTHRPRRRFNNTARRYVSSTSSSVDAVHVSFFHFLRVASRVIAVAKNSRVQVIVSVLAQPFVQLNIGQWAFRSSASACQVVRHYVFRLAEGETA